MVISTPQLHPIPVKAPWYHIGIYFIGPVNPTSRQGNRFVLTISDYFSKFVEAVPLPSKNADGVYNVLFKIFMRMGIPKVLTTDNGSEFRNDLEMRLAKALGVKRIYTTSYHPQGNGLDERFNQTLQNMLVKFIMDKKDVWDVFLDTCVYAYNTSVHESTSFSPFEVIFGCRALMPVDIEIDKETPIINNEATSGADIERLSEFVLKKDCKRKKRAGAKLETRYVGPYMIMKIHGQGFYRLKQVGNEECVVERINGAHLKPYQVADESSEIKLTMKVKLLSSIGQYVKIGKKASVRCLEFVRGNISHVPEPCAFSTFHQPAVTGRILGDGSCFFRALAHVVTGSQEDHYELRVIKHNMQHNAEDLSCYLEANDCMEDYLVRPDMQSPSVWATEQEIFAAAYMLATPIFVFSKCGHMQVQVAAILSCL
ncbi:hypothetical protein EMCRGX_G017682 [Ephydatia muelleri]